MLYSFFKVKERMDTTDRIYWIIDNNTNCISISSNQRRRASIRVVNSVFRSKIKKSKKYIKVN